MSNLPPLLAPLSRSVSTFSASPAAPIARSNTSCVYPHDLLAASLGEFPATPTCPPPILPPPTNCCSQFPDVVLYPDPPVLRRTDSASNYAVSPPSPPPSNVSNLDLIEHNFRRLSVIEDKLGRQMVEIGAIRESLYQLSRRIVENKTHPEPRSSPVTRQVASPHTPDITREFGM